jgi:hypothetical protein
MRRSVPLAALSLLAAAACTPPAAREIDGMPSPSAATTAAAPTDAASLIRAMHDRYAGRWYRTLTFTQKTTRTPPGREPSVETWYEYGALPGRLRIEIGPPENGRGALYANDSLYVIEGGRVARRIGQRNELMTLGFDVYAQAPEVTLRQLREEGFQLEPFRTDVWQGRPAYVVGGAPGDLKSKQFWVDAERLVFVRMTDRFAGDTTKVEEILFNRYEPAGGGWIAPEVEILVDGQRIFFEEYSDVRVDVPLDPALFVPERWTTAPKPAS